MMLKIGDFSKLSRISIRMLRYYDEAGLLRPESVDSFTGYRQYSVSQLVQAGRIQALKQMGFGTQRISEILNRYTHPEELESFLLQQRKTILAEQVSLEERLLALDSTLERLRKDGTIMEYQVNLKTLPERYVASVRMTLPAYPSEGELWRVMGQETHSLHMQDANPPYALVIYHDGEFREHTVDLEAQKAVVGQYADTEHVTFKIAPSVQYAGAVFKGGYDKIGQVNQAVAQWISDNGYEMDGLSFNLYYVSPKETDNPDEYVTEVCYPVRKRSDP